MNNDNKVISSEIINSRYLDENLFVYDSMYDILKKENNKFKKSDDYEKEKIKYFSFMSEVNKIEFPEYVSEQQYSLIDDEELKKNLVYYGSIINDDKLYKLFSEYYKKVNLRFINLKLKYLRASKILQTYVIDDRLDVERFNLIEEKLNILSDLIYTEQELLNSVAYDIVHGNGKNINVIYDFLYQSINTLEPEYKSIVSRLNNNRLEEFRRLNEDPLDGIKTTKHNSLLLVLKM